MGRNTPRKSLPCNHIQTDFLIKKIAFASDACWVGGWQLCDQFLARFLPLLPVHIWHCSKAHALLFLSQHVIGVLAFSFEEGQTSYITVTWPFDLLLAHLDY